MEKDEIRYRGGPVINYSKCIGCGTCYNICPTDIFKYDEKTHLVTVAYPNECWYCGACSYDCPRRELFVPNSPWHVCRKRMMNLGKVEDWK